MDLDIASLNSATKYPSIQTYHGLDPKDGSLLEAQVTPFTGPVILTEKVDGTNGRIVILPGGDWFIGSREELLHARGDRIVNPALSIVPTLLPLAEKLAAREVPSVAGTPGIEVFFLEVYGHRIGQRWKQYARTSVTGYRLFDLAFVPSVVLKLPRDKISSWRENGGQEWTPEGSLLSLCASWDVPVVPRLGIVDAASLPPFLDGMLEFLREQCPLTACRLDAGPASRAEGVVMRSWDRSAIAKARFQDYERTLRVRAMKAR